MVSSVTGTAQQQIPAANTFQPGGGAEQVGQREQREETKAAGASASESQKSETRNNGNEQRETRVASSRSEDDGQVKSRASRGSVVDLTV